MQIIYSIPDYMKDVFVANDIPEKDLLFAIHTDMTINGDFSDAYVAVDRENMYIVYGIEQVVRTENAKRLVAEYVTHEVITHQLNTLGKLSTETLLTTCRLIATKELQELEQGEEGEGEKEKQEKQEKQELILMFSLGNLSFVERLIKVVTNLEKDLDPLTEVRIDEELFCPDCGTRYPEPERAMCPHCADNISLFVRLLSFFKYYKKQVAMCTIVMVLITGLSILAPYFGTMLLVDEVLTPEGRLYRMVGSVIGLLILVRFLNMVFQVLYQIVLAKTMPWIIYDLQLRIFEAMQRLSVSFYTSKRTGTLMNRVFIDARNIYWFFVDGLPFILVNTTMFIGIFIVMFIMEWRLALIAFIIIPSSLFMFRILMRLFRQYWHKSWVLGSQLNNMVSDAVNGQRVIKAFSREDEESQRFTELGKKQALVNTNSHNLGWTAFPLIYLFIFSGQVIVTAVGGMMVIRGTISLGVFLTFLAYLGMLYGPIEFMSSVSNWWARCVDSAQRVFEIIDAKSDIIESKNPTKIEEFRGDINIKDVWFQYEPAKPILKGLTLRVPAGKTLGIVGKTGSGKSTLANLIARLYDPNEGKIYIDGVNIKRLPIQQLRTSIGIVSQEIYLFIGTIMDNIRYARPNATIEEVVWAAKMASAHDFIVKLPDGYETRVGAGGQDLSGGERQRLSIARTIIQNPKILILDEATAAMDTETEGKIQVALNKLQANRTTIAIAHRLSTLKDADNLAVINEGIVVENGTHEELMRKKGEYHKLYTIQLEGLKVISMD